MAKQEFKMYILYKGWVTDYSDKCYRSHVYGNVNFEYGEIDRASKLTYDDVICTIDNMQRVNRTYMIFPEDKFIELYKKDKIKNPEKYDFIRGDILNPSKLDYNVRSGFLLREYSEGGFFREDFATFPYYTLRSEHKAYTSPIINYKFEDGKHIFETYNSFYRCENMIDINYTDTVVELKKYLNSPYKEKIIKYHERCEKEEREKAIKESKKRIKKGINNNLFSSDDIFGNVENVFDNETIKVSKNKVKKTDKKIKKKVVKKVKHVRKAK